MRLIMVRHGETVENREGVIHGHGAGRLTERGREQARKLALRLKDEKISAIYSSDLQRAKETTEMIAKYHQVPVYYTPQLREMNFGILEGKPVGEHSEFWEDKGKPVENFREFRGKKGSINIDRKPQGGESLREIKERAQRFLNKLLKEHGDKTVLASTHGLFIRMMLGNLLKKPIEEMLQLSVSNASINVIEVGGNSENKLNEINCISHL